MVCNNIAILFGGNTDEHEISISSTKYIYNILVKSQKDFNIKLFYFNNDNQIFQVTYNNIKNNSVILEKAKKITLNKLISILKNKIVFPVNYGRCAEDGKLYALMEMYNIDTLGGPYNSYVLTFDKVFTKYYLLSRNFLTIPYKHYNLMELSIHEIIDDIIHTFKNKAVILKPRFNGSSIGISLINTKDKKEIEKAILKVKQVDKYLISEEFISNAREFQIALIKSLGKYYKSQIVEFTSKSDFLTYEEKNTSFSTMKSIYCPQNIANIREKIEKNAIEIMNELQLKNFVRLDFLYDGSKLYINEISPMFGLSKKSGFWELWRAKGYNDSETIDLILEEYTK